MTESQRLAGQIADLRKQQLAAPTPEEKAALYRQITALEAKQTTAQEAEQRAADDAFGAGHHSAESREFAALVDGFDVGQVLRFVGTRGHAPDSQVAELQQHHGKDGNFIPPEILNPNGGGSIDPRDSEQRAAATFTAGTEPGTARGITGEAIGASLIQYLGGRIENVNAGAADYPVLATGASITYPAGSADATQTTGAFTVHKLTPKRAEGQFALRREDLATYPGSALALRLNLQNKARDGLEYQVLRRAANGLMTTGHSPVPSTPTAESTHSDYLSAVYAGVDGLHSQAVAQVGLLVGQTIYAHAGATYRTSGPNVIQDLAGSAGARVSPHVAAYAANAQDAIVIRRGLAPSNLAAALWGMELIDDPYTRALQGEIVYTGILLHDFAVLRSGAFVRHRFRNS